MIQKNNNFLSSQHGAVAPLIGIMLFTLIAVTGIAIDSGRVYLVRSKMSNALDSALIAAADIATASRIADDPESIRQRAYNFFRANYPANYLGVDIPDSAINIDIDADTGRLSGNVEGDVPTLFGSIYNVIGLGAGGTDYSDFGVGVFSEIARQASSVEVSFVVDNSTSMCAFSTDAPVTGESSDCDKFDQVQQRIEELVSDVNDAFDTASTPNNEDGAYFAYIPYTHEVQIDGSDKNSVTCDAGIQFPSAVGLQRIEQGDYDTSDLAASLGLSTSLGGPSDLGGKPIQLESGTNTAKGLWWGWASLRPDRRNLFVGTSAHENNTYPSTFQQVLDFQATKVLVLLTDGRNLYPNFYCNSGKPKSGRDADGVPGGPVDGFTADSLADSEFDNICSSIKQQGILLYTITYDAQGDTTLLNKMAACSSGDGYNFDASDSAALDQAFEDITNSLIGLRISQ